MIFVTIGTQQQNFKRLFDYVNQIDTDEEIIVQKGKSKYKLNDNIKVYDFLSYEEMDHLLNTARVVISHGGTGTIFNALKKEKKLIVVPRLAAFREHVNNHQLEFSFYLQEHNYCFVVRSLEEFNEAFGKIDKHKFKKYVSNEKEFIDNVEKEINSLLGI